MALNETLISAIPMLSPVFDTIRKLVQEIQWIMGGMFGIYLLLVFLRWKEARTVAKILSEIRDDIKELSADIKAVNEKVNFHVSQKKH